jgi:alanine dehydrogenase
MQVGDRIIADPTMGDRMIIAVPKEIKDQEFRVGLTPVGVETLCAAGHSVWVESGAGTGSGFLDEEYLKAGGQITDSKTRLFEQADLVVKVKEPLQPEYALLRPQQILFTFLHLAASSELTRALVKSGVTAIAYETTEAADGSLPILAPMSEIAGRMAVQIGAHYLERTQQGRGVLLGGVPGVEPGHVVILGAGIVGSAAARIAVGLGARVTIINLDLSRLEHLDAVYRGRVTTLAASRNAIDQSIVEADLVIGAVMARGAPTPKLVSRKMLGRMRQGSVVVDVSVDQGGCFETTRPTSHSDPVYEVDGVLHYCVPNIPGIVPRTSTLALTNTTLPFIVRLTSGRIDEVFRANPGLMKGVNISDGNVVSHTVAEAHGMRYERLT